MASRIYMACGHFEVRGRQWFARNGASRGGDAEHKFVLGVYFLSKSLFGAARLPVAVRDPLPPAQLAQLIRGDPPRRDYHPAVTILRRDHGPVGRYSLDDVVLEIAKARKRLGLRDRDIYEACGISQPQWAHKMANAGKSHFSLREIGLVADFFARRLGRPLTGWPVIPLAVCDEIDAVLEAAHGKARRKPAQHR
jgi:hypothetical protein